MSKNKTVLQKPPVPSAHVSVTISELEQLHMILSSDLGYPVHMGEVVPQYDATVIAQATYMMPGNDGAEGPRIKYLWGR